MSNSHLPKHPITYIDHAMYGLKRIGKGNLSSEEMMKKLACKIQGDKQTNRNFAAEVELGVINIYMSYPQRMNESLFAETEGKILW